VLIKIVLGSLFKKLNLAKFETEKFDCRFGTFGLVGDRVICSKFETITIKKKIVEILPEIPTFLPKNIW